MQPLSKLTFTRDQQLLTAKGVVLANPMFPNRAKEPRVLRRVWQALDIQPLADLTGELKLEGGDFLSVSPKLCLIGVGLRTNWQAVEYLLAQDLFGTVRVVVVVDTTDLHSQRMHLDTVLNLIAPGVVMALEDVLGEGPRSRHVVEYSRRVRGARCMRR